MKRSFSNAALLSAVLCATSLTGLKTASATKFINRSDKTVFVARGEYEPYSSQPDVTPARYRFDGWYRVAPGDVVNVPQGWLYVQDHRGRALTWANLKTMTGVIKDARFSAYVSKRTPQQDLHALKNRGFKTVRYMRFGNGTYSIAGTAYGIRTVKRSFSHESRSAKYVQNSYQLPGKIAGYSVNYSNKKWANVTWKVSKDGRRVFYGGFIEGRKPNFSTGGRQKAKFIGTVTIHYVYRK